MTTVGFTSVHGSPGTTSLAVACAHHWRAHAGRPALLLEADADGGVLAARHGLSVQPGLTDLAGAARSGIDPAGLFAFSQTMTSGVPVIVAHPAAEQTSAALRTSAVHLSACLEQMGADDANDPGLDLGVDVIVDLGRLRPGAPCLPLAGASDVLVVAVRCVPEDLVSVLTRLEPLGRIAPLQLALVGPQPLPFGEVRRASGIETIHGIPYDPTAVASDPAAARGRRSAWRRAVAEMTASLCAATTLDATDGGSGDETSDGVCEFEADAA